jgi:hypothetical protein
MYCRMPLGDLLQLVTQCDLPAGLLYCKLQGSTLNKYGPTYLHVRGSLRGTFTSPSPAQLSKIPESIDHGLND